MKHGVSVIFLYRRIGIVTLSALICLGVQAIGGQNRAVATGMTYGMSRVLADHPQPINWSGNYFQMKDGALDKWDFCGRHLCARRRCRRRRLQQDDQ